MLNRLATPDGAGCNAGWEPTDGIGPTRLSSCFGRRVLGDVTLAERELEEDLSLARVRCHTAATASLGKSDDTQGVEVDKARGPRLSVFGLLLLPLIAGGTVGAAAPQPHGHWSGHLASAGAAAGQLAALAAISALLRRRLRSSKVVLTAAVAIGLSLEVVGNSIAANSIWATPHGDEEAGFIGPLKDGFELEPYDGQLWWRCRRRPLC